MIAALAALPDPIGLLVREAGRALVLDAAGERVLAANEAAEGLASLVADAQGLVRPAAREPWRRLASSLPTGPRLERLRFDPGRLAPPLVCTCLRAELPEQGPVLVVIPADGARRAAPLAETSPTEERPLAPPADVSAPRPSVRFLWRSDAEDRLVAVSSLLADRVRGGVLGRTWGDLRAGPVIDSKHGLGEALGARETFRSVPVRWRVAGLGRTLAIDLSATPLRAPDGAFAGFAGFGVIEEASAADAPSDGPPDTEAASVLPAPTALALTPASPESAGEPDVALDRPSPTSLAGAATASFADVVPAAIGGPVQGEAVAEPVSPSTAPDAGDIAVATHTAHATTVSVPGSDPICVGEDPTGSDDEAPASRSKAPAPSDAETQLSLSEHSAFREIARALGARFAGDEAGDKARDDRVADDARAGAVTPFRARAGDRGEGVSSPARQDSEAGGSGEADTRRLLDRLPIGVLVHRGETALYANRAFLESVDYPDVAALGAEGGVGRLFRGGEAGRRSADGAALALSTRSGAAVPVEVRLTAVEWNGQPAGILLVRRLPEIDPAQRVAALELDLAARSSRVEALAATLDAAGDGALTLDGDLRLVALDRRAERLFGYDEREVAGEPVDLLLASESRPYLRILAAAARASGSAAGEVVGRRRTGGPFALDVRLARLPGPDASLGAVLRDASAIRATADALATARRALEAANDRQAAFLRRMGHGVRSPLNAILGFAELLMREPFGPIGNERYRAYLRDIHAAGRRVVGLVDGLVDLARVEAGRGDLAFAPVDLNTVAAACVAELQPRAAGSRIIVRTSFAPALPAILADGPSLAQIAANVVANAIRFTGAGGQVIVSTALTDRGEVALRVRDTGVGMKPEAIAAALDPFHVADTATAEGVGLGLPIARALATANRAALSVASTVGEGTLVELVVPAGRVLRDGPEAVAAQ